MMITINIAPCLQKNEVNTNMQSSVKNRLEITMDIKGNTPPKFTVSLNLTWFTLNFKISAETN